MRLFSDENLYEHQLEMYDVILDLLPLRRLT